MDIKVAIPVYNVEEYVERCLRSVVSQTYNDLECIIVDDASPDSSMSVVASFVESYKGNIPFSIIHHPENQGLSAARNTGTSHATGDYIFYLDSDDEITPECIEKLVGKVEEYPGVDMVQGNTKAIPYFSYVELKSYKFPSFFSNNEEIRNYYYDPFKRYPSTAWNKLIRTDFIRKNNISFLENVIHEDNHWMFQVVRYIQTIAFEFDYTYIYYRVPNSIISKTTNEKSAKSMGIILYDLGLHIEEKDYDRQFIKYLYYLAVWISNAPHIKELKDTCTLYTKLSRKHNWYDIYTILSLTKILWFSKSAVRIGALLCHRRINHHHKNMFLRQKSSSIHE